ncbi:BTAD domain-containing putative transcriptional regulator [Nocardia sp. NPDC050193]
MNAPAAPPGSGKPLLIALAGLGPRVGTTTTTLALAQTWPGSEPTLIVEADPAGGQLADMVGADPYLGLASLARTVAIDGVVDADRLTEHVQFLPGGVALLAAPPGPGTADPVSAASLLTGAHSHWRPALGATVFADCGCPEPDSDLAAVLAAADACLVVLRADHRDPEVAARRIRALTRHSPRRAVVLIGAGARSEFAQALALPLPGTVPHARAEAEALLHGTTRRRPHLLPAARNIAAAVHYHLHPPASHTRPDQPPARPPARRSRHPHTPVPTIYRLDLPPSPLTGPSAPGQPPTRRPGELTVPPDSDHAQRPADAGQPAELRPATESAVLTRADPPHPTALSPGLTVRIFGQTQILWRAPGSDQELDVTSRLQPRSREALAVLALHPGGVNRSSLVEMLWGQHRPERATAALTNTLSRLRTAVTAATGGQVTGLLIDDRLHCRLSETALTIDYWEFNAAVAARRRAGNDEDQATACRRITDLATTDLAPDLTGAWVEPLRESARRDALNALSWLATRNAENDPRATLGLLEESANSDPYNETVWQDILRLHARLGEYSALTRTYSLMTRKLAEIGQTPNQETRQLLDRLRQPEK